jgi:hypothetical protein
MPTDGDVEDQCSEQPDGKKNQAHELVLGRRVVTAKVEGIPTSAGGQLSDDEELVVGSGQRSRLCNGKTRAGDRYLQGAGEPDKEQLSHKGDRDRQHRLEIVSFKSPNTPILE